ncbi:MAG: MOSC domain-containing protein [Acidobacteriota bacterium]
MKVISVNVGVPRAIVWKGRDITTGIFKAPVAGRVKVDRLNIEGDRQADLTVHGGADKAIYVYPSEHYEFWRGELPEMDLPWAAFGENLTTEGLLEDRVNIGDRFRIGTIEVMVTQPRMPCYKLSAKFDRDDIIKRFLASRRSGFYLAVTEEGEIGAGDEIEPVIRDACNITVTDIVRLYVDKPKDFELMKRAVQVEALSEGWRTHFQDQLAKMD